MSKGWVTLGEAKSTGFPSHLDCGLELQDISITMADEPGYVIFRNSIPTELADEAAAAIHFGLTPIHSHAKYFEYPMPPIGMTVYKEFMKEGKGKIQEFIAPTALPEKTTSINVGIFRSIDPPDPLPTIRDDGYVLITIALTRLNAESGWYVLCEGSHQLPRNSPVSELRKRNKSLNLAPGDAIIWRSELATIQTQDGGGKFEVLVFKL